MRDLSEGDRRIVEATARCVPGVVGGDSPDIASGEPAKQTGLFLLAGGGFGGDGRVLLLAGVVGLGLFLAGFLLVGFRGFIAHNFFMLVLRLTGLRHGGFSAGN